MPDTTRDDRRPVTLSLTVIGYSGAAPLAGACPSYAVSDGDSLILLDCGPGTLERLWRARAAEADRGGRDLPHAPRSHARPRVGRGRDRRSELAGKQPTLYVPRDAGPRVLDALDAVFAESPAAREPVRAGASRSSSTTSGVASRSARFTSASRPVLTRARATRPASKTTEPRSSTVPTADPRTRSSSSPARPTCWSSRRRSRRTRRPLASTDT